MLVKKIIIVHISMLMVQVVCAQTLEGGMIRDLQLRDLQLLGKGRSDKSFALRSVALGELPDSVVSSFRKPSITLLPLSWLSQFNSQLPFSENDGSLIAAKGLQTRLSGGVQVRAGFVEMQLAPELVWAANPTYNTTTQYGFNNGKSFQRIYPGQSTLQLVAGGFQGGISTANQWWGPGVRNSLLMTYQAPGFTHFFLGSRRPLKTPIGSIEWKLMGGWLRTDGDRSMENRNLRAADAIFGQRKRYLSGLTISYQPKWIPGLFVGFNRVIQTFNKDSLTSTLGAFERYFPVIALAAQKKNVLNEDLLDRDQVASFFLRWLFPKQHFEFYVEYGYNDYKLNTRDYLLGTSHSAAHIFGVKKVIPQHGDNRWIDITLELTKMSQTPDQMVRDAGNWYEHNSIIEGYTHDNQIIGSIYGFGADAVFAGVSLVRGAKRLGFFIEQINRDPVNRTQKWVDLGFGFTPQWVKDKWILGGKLELVRTRGFAWQTGKNVMNLHAQIALQYKL